MKQMISLVLVLCTSSVINAAEKIGDWHYSITDPDTLWAVSMNDSGNIFGQYCSIESDTCIWLLGLHSACKKGNNYQILANSEWGAVHLQVKCDDRVESGLYRYVFTEFDKVESLIKSGSLVGFAIPLSDGLFTVVRFSLDGSFQARQEMFKAGIDRKNKNTKDVVM